MLFLNAILLTALGAVAIPIILHLLRRGRARPIDWGAMQFLLASLASRSRRVFLEETVLLIVRCLLIALMVLAMARPFLPATSSVPWGVVVPLGLAAILCLAVGTAMWSRPRRRWGLYAAALAMLAIAVVACAREQLRHGGRRLSAGARQDIAIVLDSSLSMGLADGTERKFDRALREARELVGSLRGGDAASLLLAGAVPRALIPVPVSDTPRVLSALGALDGPGRGRADIPAALHAAAASLVDGPNPGKWIVLLTDAQSVGWDLRNSGRWRHLAESLAGMPHPPRIVVRLLGVPEICRNAALTDLTLSREVVGTDRAVRIDVKLLNAGTLPLAPGEVTLAIDGRDLAPRSVGALAPNAAETVRFEHRFIAPGPHVLTARAGHDDDLPGDNVALMVVNVARTLPVLLVEGSPSVDPLAGEATFIRIALAPGGASTRHRASVGPEAQSRYLVRTTLVDAPDLDSVADFGDYRAVVLAGVGRLSARASARIAEFVRGGGGLLIAPSHDARADFYNHWTDRAGKSVCPAKLAQWTEAGESPDRLAPRTFRHPALETLSEPAYSRDALVQACWRLEADERDPDVRVAGRLQSGLPLLVEGALGEGRVLISAVSLGPGDNNLRTLKPLFVPLVHELTYYLAGGTLQKPNVSPGAEVLLDLPLVEADAGGLATNRRAPVAGDLVSVTGPDGRVAQARVVSSDSEHIRIAFSESSEPGLYRVLIPPQLRPRLAVRPVGDTDRGWPFVVLSDPEESRLTPLDAGDLQRGQIAQANIVSATSVDETISILRGAVPGQEMWRYLALAAVLALLAEILISRWITSQRRAAAWSDVPFGGEDADFSAMRRAGAGER
jgi:aerotolerance regulator-like protein/VWA domain-containing protein